MLATVRTITEFLEGWARPEWACPGDSIGLVTGDPQDEATHIIICLDLVPEVVEGAPPRSLVICHHPVFTGEDRVTLRADHPVGALLARALRRELALFVAHTNLDAAPGGTADALAERLGLLESVPLDGGKRERYLKLAVFVPSGHEEAVREAMARAGAGWIGNYSHCSFQLAGQGTFKPGAGADPFIGRPGQVEKVDELRIETILPEHLAGQVVEAVVAAHPYEEVAYDLYPLVNPGPVRSPGRLGRLPAPMTLAQLAALCRQRLGANVRYAGQRHRTVASVALVPGAGGALLAAAAELGAEVLITGDVRHHQVVEARLRGLSLVDAGHAATEAPVLEAVAGRVCARLRSIGCENSVEVWPVTDALCPLDPAGAGR